MYDDIINLPHHVSSVHPPMSMESRAAQFAPFAALTGHGEAIAETARITEQKPELSDFEKEQIDIKIRASLQHCTAITLIYFEKDMYKNGGAYITTTGIITKFHEVEKTIELNNGIQISIDDILKIL